jgi:formylglycine-generating enzyme required for sulfatase activity
MKIGLSAFLAAASIAASPSLSGCGGTSSSPTGVEARAPELEEVFEGVPCSAVRPQTEPDLMAWDAGSRGNLSRLRKEGVVAVRYAQEGCNVRLELLSNCIGAASQYRYTPYGESQSKVARSAQELFAELPVGAARFAGKLRGQKALRADYTLVGLAALPAGSSYKRADLKGPPGECARATHVVSAVYLGGFAMVAGDARAVDAEATVFGVGGGAKASAEVERLDNAGDPVACEEARKSGQESGQCATPLRIGLLALDGEPACPAGSRWDGSVCAAEVKCFGGTHFVAGTGCVPDAPPPAAPQAEAPVAPAPAAAAAPAASTAGSCPGGMALIPKGKLWMGSEDGSDDEKPVHQVEVQAFCMDLTEVTVAAYAACARSGDCPSAPTTTNWGSADDVKLWSQFCNGARSDRQNHPINCVDATQAETFCRAADKRLPTEEEWEYAARGREGRKYPWGDAAPGPTLLNACGSECKALGARLGKSWSVSVMYDGNDGWESTAPVGSYPAGRSPFGLYDMAGNVWEWTGSGYSENYDKTRGTARVYRGGGWYGYDASGVRGAYRNGNAPSYRGYVLGFRCARSNNR